MKLMHIFFRVLAQSMKIEASELTEKHITTFYQNQKNSHSKLPVSISFGVDNDLEVVHEDWGVDHLITGFRLWRTINNFDK